MKMWMSVFLLATMLNSIFAVHVEKKTHNLKKAGCLITFIRTVGRKQEKAYCYTENGIESFAATRSTIGSFKSPRNLSNNKAQRLWQSLNKQCENQNN